MSQLMIQAGAEKIGVPMKCDVEAFAVWYGDDVPMEDTEEAFEVMRKYQGEDAV